MLKSATAASAETPETSDTPPKDPWAWNDNPTVVVSRRTRIIQFPGALLRGPVDEATQSAWLRDPGDPRNEYDAGLARNQDRRDLVLSMGVTFLGEFTSSWLYRTHETRDMPRQAPPPDRCTLLEPFGRNAFQALQGAAVKDPETARRRPDKVREAWHRVLGFLRRDDNEARRLFVAEDGFDAPDVMVLPLREALTASTDLGRHANAALLDALNPRAHIKDFAHLGGLHDYAVRERQASNVRDACRVRAQAIDASRL